MVDYTFYIHIFISLFSILNPFGVIPVFLSVTADESRQRKKNTIKKTVLSVMIILIVSAYAGNYILNFFGISIDSFRIAGGILLLLMAIHMLQAKTPTVKNNEDETNEAVEKDDVAVVPLAIPLIAGPGAISTIIVYSSSISGVLGMALLSVIIVITSALIFPILLLSKPIGERIGTTGLNIVTRVMGLILAAISIQFIMTGVAHFLKINFVS